MLNAKNDAEEAAIIAEAGAFGAVTVSTQMAGRGIDIRLGGSDEKDQRRGSPSSAGSTSSAAGRHDSRRVDDQLRGRAGRQGDPGESVFFVSLEDELITRYGPASAADAPQTDPDGRVTRRGAITRRSRTPSGSPRGSTWRSTATRGDTTCCWSSSVRCLANTARRLLTTDAAAELLQRAAATGTHS